MQKLLEPQTYTATVFTIWVVMVPMIVKDLYGFVPSLIAAMLVGLIGMGLARATMSKAANVKWATMAGSFLLIVGLMLAFVEPARSPETAQTVQATE